MNKSIENPLFEMGTFLVIMNYYDYAHMAVLVSRMLSKTCRELFMKWENFINESWKKISIFVNEDNSSILEHYCKFRELKFLDLEIELRRGENITLFKNLLLFFKDIKDEDINKFNILCQENPHLEKSKVQYVAQNYIGTYNFEYLTKITFIDIKQGS